MADARPRPSAIQSYGSGGFTVSGQRYEGAVAVLPFHTVPWSPPADPAVLSRADLTPVLDEVRAAPGAVEIVLIGCGSQIVQPPPAVLAPLREALKAVGATLDLMDTGAACRTFNLLLGEGRRVAALLMPVP